MARRDICNFPLSHALQSAKWPQFFRMLLTAFATQPPGRDGEHRRTGSGKIVLPHKHTRLCKNATLVWDCLCCEKQSPFYFTRLTLQPSTFQLASLDSWRRKWGLELFPETNFRAWNSNNKAIHWPTSWKSFCLNMRQIKIASTSSCQSHHFQLGVTLCTAEITIPRKTSTSA